MPPRRTAATCSAPTGTTSSARKLRGNNKEAKAALSRQGRYHVVAGNLRVKEVIIDDGTMRDRFVVCHNPDEAARDKQIREALIAQITDAITGSDALSAAHRAKLHGQLAAKRGLKRFLRQTKSGLLRVDRAAVNSKAHLDGKFLLCTSDPTLSVEDIALGYKQLLEIERGWRDMKTTLDLRPVRPPAGRRRADRVRRPPTPPTRPSRPLRSRPSADHRTATAKFHGERDIL